MQYIRLTNDKKLPVLGVHAQYIQYGGIQRDHLIFLFDPNVVSLAEIEAEFIPSNCQNITIARDKEEFNYPGYTILLGFGYANRNKVINAPAVGPAATDDSTAAEVQEPEMVNFVKMVQTTLAERSIENQQEVLDALVVEALMREAE